ncbi:MAG: Phytoene dehydrogenase, partial [uncultured Solirubrobacteraceae bacterium]
EGRGGRRGPRRAGSRAAAAGRGARRDRRRAARPARRARLSAARRGLHVGHGAVADHDALGARGHLRGGRPRPARRGDDAPPRPALPDLLGRRGRALRLRRRPRWPARRGREVLHPRRRAPRRLPRGAQADLRAGDRRRGPQAVPLLRRLRAARAEHGPAGRDPPAAPLRLEPLRARARARGVLLPLAVHRRRPLPRAGDLRRARLPADHRRRLVHRRRRVLARRGARAAARRPLRDGGRGDRALGRPRPRGPAGRRGADRGRRRGLQRRRAARARAARPARPAAQARPHHVGVPALPGDGPAVSQAPAPHAHGGVGVQGLHPRRDPGHGAAADVLDLRARAVAHRAGDGRERRRLDLRAPPRPQPARRRRLGARRRRPAGRGGRRLRGHLRPHRPRRLGRRRAPDDPARLRDGARRDVRQRLRRRADPPPVGVLPPAQPRPLDRGDVLRGRWDAPGRRHPGRAAERRGHGEPDHRRPSRSGGRASAGGRAV